jgi:hypothetical protein
VGVQPDRGIRSVRSWPSANVTTRPEESDRFCVQIMPWQTACEGPAKAGHYRRG